MRSGWSSEMAAFAALSSKSLHLQITELVRLVTFAQ